MSTGPSTPQRPTSALTLSVLQNATTPVRNRVLLTPTRNKQKRCYDPLEDLKALGVLLNLRQEVVVENDNAEELEEIEADVDDNLLDESMDTIYKMSKQYKIDSFTTKNLSGFRLSGSSNVDSRDVSFDTNKRTRLSISSLPNTSNIAIPEAVLNDDDDDEGEEENSSQNSFDLNELNEFQVDEIPDFNIPYEDQQEGDYSIIEQHDEFITKRRKSSINNTLRTPKQQQKFSLLMLKKLVANLDSSLQWDTSSSETINFLNEVTRTFIDKELLTLDSIRELSGGYKSIGFSDVEFLMQQVSLFNDNDLLNDCSQSALLDLSIKLFDLESVKDLEVVLYGSKKRRKFNVGLNVAEEESEEESEHTEEFDEQSDEQDDNQSEQTGDYFDNGQTILHEVNNDLITTPSHNKSNGFPKNEKANEFSDNQHINSRNSQEVTDNQYSQGSSDDQNSEVIVDEVGEILVDNQSSNFNAQNNNGSFDIPQDLKTETATDGLISDSAEDDLVDFANFNSEIALGITVSEDESEKEDYSIPIADEEEEEEDDDDDN